jgi:hypothetical protein
LATIAAILLASYLVRNVPGYAYAPAFSTADFIYANGTQLDIGMDAAPVVVDWNEDGKKDLLLGDYDGYVSLYLNYGTNAEPVFFEMQRVLVGGRPIRVGAG